MGKLLRSWLVGLSVIFAIGLLVYLPSTAITQTADGETPAEEDVCDGLSGRSYGLCNAYCEAMDCESSDPQASDDACDKVLGKFMDATGGDEPPCTGGGTDICSGLQQCNNTVGCKTGTGQSGKCGIDRFSGNCLCIGVSG